MAPNSYCTNNLTADEVLGLMYLVPLAPHYLDKGVFYEGGRVHGNFQGMGSLVFLFEPDDMASWQTALEVNRTLPPLTEETRQAGLQYVESCIACRQTD